MLLEAEKIKDPENYLKNLSEEFFKAENRKQEEENEKL